MDTPADNRPDRFAVYAVGGDQQLRALWHEQSDGVNTLAAQAMASMGLQVRAGPTAVGQLHHEAKTRYIRLGVEVNGLQSLPYYADDRLQHAQADVWQLRRLHPAQQECGSLIEEALAKGTAPSDSPKTDIVSTSLNNTPPAPSTKIGAQRELPEGKR